jgi:oxygen-independent coproporphyrinogen-3 oxidase
VYALTIEPGTQFGALARKGRLPLLDEDAVAESILRVSAELRSRGFSHYEVSNYARDRHYAEHNLVYWRGGDYLGLGTGAWGTVTLGRGRLRYRNTPVPDRYLDSPAQWDAIDLEGSSALVRDLEPLDPETELAERILLGLRLAEGVDLAAAARDIGVDPWTRGRRAAVDRLLREERLVRVGDRLRIPEAHWLFADAIIRDVM